MIIPAIDLMNGECVRLQQGDPEKKTIYSHSPEEVAHEWVRQGARRIHVVDLDGAFAGRPKNLDAISRIRESVDVEIECGGGLREEGAIEQALDAGIDYAIVGSRALTDTAFFAAVLQRFGRHIILGLDARDGMLSIHGWKKNEKITPAEFLETAKDKGVHTVIYTDISRDGMLSGANTTALKELAQQFPTLSFIASGGISSLDDIRELVSLNLPNLSGIITGKALYEKQFTVAEALRIAGGEE